MGVTVGKTSAAAVQAMKGGDRTAGRGTAAGTAAEVIGGAEANAAAGVAAIANTSEDTLGIEDTTRQRTDGREARDTAAGAIAAMAGGGVVLRTATGGTRAERVAPATRTTDYGVTREAGADVIVVIALKAAIPTLAATSEVGSETLEEGEVPKSSTIHRGYAASDKGFDGRRRRSRGSREAGGSCQEDTQASSTDHQGGMPRLIRVSTGTGGEAEAREKQAEAARRIRKLRARTLEAVVITQRIARGFIARNRVAGRREALAMLRIACLGVAMDVIHAHIREEAAPDVISEVLGGGIEGGELAARRRAEAAEAASEILEETAASLIREIVTLVVTVEADSHLDIVFARDRRNPLLVVVDDVVAEALRVFLREAVVVEVVKECAEDFMFDKRIFALVDGLIEDGVVETVGPIVSEVYYKAASVAIYLEAEEELCAKEARLVVAETMAPFEDQLVEMQREKDFAAVQAAAQSAIVKGLQLQHAARTVGQRGRLVLMSDINGKTLNLLLAGRFLAILRAAETNRLQVSTSPLLFTLFRRLVVRTGRSVLLEELSRELDRDEVTLHALELARIEERLLGAAPTNQQELYRGVASGKMFFDLNVPVLRSSVERDRSALLSQLFQHGYDCVALNTIIYGRLPKQHRCAVERIRFEPQALSTAGRRRRKAAFREPSLLRATASGSRSGGGVGAPGHGATGETGPDQVTRLTVVLESPADAQVLTAGSEALQSYDIVAAVPCCQRSFEVVCKDSDVDVISLPSGKRLPFTINKKNADVALARGAVFEVTYSQAIQSSSARRYFVGNCQALVTFTRGRGIILASGAESWIHSRTPHDVANLGQLLGLSQEQSLRAVSDTPLAVLRRAEARKSRFRGLAIGGGSADDAARATLLESLLIPKEFYLPEAAAVSGPKRGTGGHPPAAGDKGAAVADAHQEKNDRVVDDDDDDDDGGFLSFGTSGDMEVDE
eukprot:g15974.t1